MEHFKITFEPEGTRVVIHQGATILEAAGHAAIILNTVCGGKGSCKKCTVKLAPDEKEVLACQYHIDSDLTVIVPHESRFFEQKILEWGNLEKTTIAPDIYKKYLSFALDSQIYGLAVDIGTTTIVAKLIDMTTGHTKGVKGIMNPQIKFGDDVISRINYAKTEDKREHLHKSVTGSLNKTILELCDEVAIKPDQIFEMAVVANTTMNHLFLNLPVSQLGQAPYYAHSLEDYDNAPADFNIGINSNANIHTVGNIAGFVGSDTVAAGLAVNIANTQQNTLLIDIGTNGEILLATDHELYAASCAAGPAFEGAKITQGSRAVNGAIEAVVINHDDIDIDVIGNCPARSICGSGLIDAVAVMLDLGVIDETGKFVEKEKLKASVPSPVRDRLIIEENGQPAFILAHNDDSDLQKVVLNQKDIRQLQLAKAAIRTGIILLQKKLEIEDSDIEKVLLAGAFGNYINKNSALRIGLLPNVDIKKVHFVGNAAASGAQLILLNSTSRQLAKDLTKKIEYIEIANEKTFTDVYADSMIF